MNKNFIADLAEQIVQDTVPALLQPNPGECLICYTHRQLVMFNCNGTHRFSSHFRDATAPRATALISRLSDMGACCCDCEIFTNAYQPTASVWFWHQKLSEAASNSDGQASIYTTQQENEDEESEFFRPPPCLQVRRGSTQPCELWQRQWRPRWRR